MNMAESAIPKFMTIREVAKTGLISEHYLREMVKAGTLPGFYTGNVFRVNFGMLIDKLNRESEKFVADQQGNRL